MKKEYKSPVIDLIDLTAKETLMDSDGSLLLGPYLDDNGDWFDRTSVTDWADGDWPA